MAKVGTRKDIVPPWTMGKRTPHVAWKYVTMPVTKIIVDIIMPRLGSSSDMQSAGVSINGIDTIAPIMVR